MTKAGGDMDILVTVTGGGLTGQAGAIRHGISRALIKSNPELALAAFEFDPNEVNYGKAAVIAKGNEDFVAAVNEVITKVASDGSFQKAYDDAVALADSMGLEMD